MDFSIDLMKSFDRISFVGEREDAEKMITNGWTPVWEPGLKTNDIRYPNYSDYFILVRNTTSTIELQGCSTGEKVTGKLVISPD